MNRQHDRNGIGKLKAPRGLVALNLALLAGLGIISVTPGATAQVRTPNTRVPGAYSIVGGASIVGFSNVIYVLDTANRELIALNWNDSTKSVEGVGYRDLSVDVTADPDR